MRSEARLAWTMALVLGAPGLSLVSVASCSADSASGDGGGDGGASSSDAGSSGDVRKDPRACRLPDVAPKTPWGEPLIADFFSGRVEGKLVGTQCDGANQHVFVLDCATGEIRHRPTALACGTAAAPGFSNLTRVTKRGTLQFHARGEGTTPGVFAEVDLDGKEIRRRTYPADTAPAFDGEDRLWVVGGTPFQLTVTDRDGQPVPVAPSAITALESFPVVTVVGLAKGVLVEVIATSTPTTTAARHLVTTAGAELVTGLPAAPEWADWPHPLVEQTPSARDVVPTFEGTTPSGGSCEVKVRARDLPGGAEIVSARPFTMLTNSLGCLNRDLRPSALTLTTDSMLVHLQAAQKYPVALPGLSDGSYMAHVVHIDRATGTADKAYSGNHRFVFADTDDTLFLGEAPWMTQYDTRTLERLAPDGVVGTGPSTSDGGTKGPICTGSKGFTSYGSPCYLQGPITPVMCTAIGGKSAEYKCDPKTCTWVGEVCPVNASCPNKPVPCSDDGVTGCQTAMCP